MRIYIEKTKSIVVSLMMLLSLGSISSCQQDYLQGETDSLAPDECVINFSIPESVDQEIITRSAAEYGENYIEDLYVLCFDNQRVFQKGEVISIASLVTADKKIVTKAIAGTRGKVILIANSEKFNSAVAADNTPEKKTERLNAAMAGKTIDEINDTFVKSWPKFKLSPSTENEIGKLMPMSSHICEYTSRPTSGLTIQLIRSYAKFRLAYDIPAGADATGLFTGEATINAHYYKFGFYPKDGFNCIYREDGTPISNPAILESEFDDLTIPVYPINNNYPGIGANLKVCYLPELPNKTSAKGRQVDPNQWNVDRAFILLRASNAASTNVQYYRLDFAKKGADGQYEFLDIVRNTYTTIKITAVRGPGYNTIEEAINTPASNIEYTIDVMDENSVVNSNGQYAICMSNDGKIIKGDKGMYDVATVSYQSPGGIDLSSVVAASSVTTNLSSSVPVELLFNGVRITSGMANPPKFVAGPNSIQLKLNDATEVNCQVYLNFGNIKNTIVVKRYPYSQDMWKLNLSAKGELRPIWDKNEAKMSVSATMLSVPYRIQKTDGYTTGVITGRFKIGTSSAAPTADDPILSRVNVDVVQKGVDGVVTRFYTNQNNGKLTVNNGNFLLATPTIGVNEILVSNPIRVQAYSYIADEKYYKVKGWHKGEVPNSTEILPSSASGVEPYVSSITNGFELTVPFTEANAGSYTAMFADPKSAKVPLVYDRNGVEVDPASMPPIVDYYIGSEQTLSGMKPIAKNDSYRFKRWREGVSGSNYYYPNDPYVMKEENNRLYAQWGSLKITFSAPESGFYDAIKGLENGETVFLNDFKYFSKVPPKTVVGTPSLLELPSDAKVFLPLLCWKDTNTGINYYLNDRISMPNSDVTFKAVYQGTTYQKVHVRKPYGDVVRTFGTEIKRPHQGPGESGWTQFCNYYGIEQKEYRETYAPTDQAFRFVLEAAPDSYYVELWLKDQSEAYSKLRIEVGSDNVLRVPVSRELAPRVNGIWVNYYR